MFPNKNATQGDWVFFFCQVSGTSRAPTLRGVPAASQGKPKGVRPAMTSLAEPLPPPSSRALALAGGRPSPDKKALPLLDKEGEGFALDTMAFLYLSHDQKERLQAGFDETWGLRGGGDTLSPKWWGIK